MSLVMMNRRQWVRDQVKYWWRKCYEVAPGLARLPDAPDDPPMVKFSNRMKRTAGFAIENYRLNTRTALFSNYFLLQETSETFEQTIVHEVVHLFVGNHHGHKGSWPVVMNRLGLQADRCHQYQHVIKRQPRIPIKCTCGKVYNVSKNKLSRIRNRTGIYSCRGCGSTLCPDVPAWTGFGGI